MDDEMMAALAGLLQTLWRLTAERPDKPCTLARLSKQAGLPMSALRRRLTALEDAGWIALALDEGGITGVASLTDAGVQLVRELFP
jgi:DNA-binding IclR family transcriptional regulator